MNKLPPIKVPKKHKYHATKTCIRVDGENLSFDSKLEADRFLVLHTMEKERKIKNLERQPEFILQKGYTRNGKKVRDIKYKADFKYEENGMLVIEDAKGMLTPEYKLKLKIFLQQYPELVFREVTRYKRGFAIKEM